MSHKDEVEYLAKRSREFLETAEHQIDKGFCSLAAFSLEQGLQLFLKSRLLTKGVDYPRTHSVRRLLEMLSTMTTGKHGTAIKALLNKYLLELGILEDAYITSRYIAREFKEEEVEVLKVAVKEVMENVARIDC